jgi:hypothetical protein
MKTSFFKKTLFCLLMTGGLYLSSCVDDKIDMDNLSTDVRLEGTYAFPALKESKITMRDLIKEYGGNTEDDAVLDSTANVHPGLVALYYEDVFPYAMNSDKNINGGFEELKVSLKTLEFDIPVASVGTAQVQGTFDLNGSISAKKGDQHNIKKIHLLGANAKITPISGVTVSKVTIKSGSTTTKYTTNVVNGSFDLPDVLIENGDSFIIDLSYASGATTPSQIELTVQPADYVVWGWFNYTLYNFEKTDSYAADISQYLDESHFEFCDPQFEFRVDNDNIGVPLFLNLRNIIVNEGFSSYRNLAIGEANGYPFEILYPKDIDQDIEPVLYNVNGDKSDVYGFNKDIYSTLVGTDLKNVATVYDLKTKDIVVTDETLPIQFVSSKGVINVHAKAILPFWIKKGSLAYSDTIKDLDLGKDEDYELDESITSVALKFTYKNHLPFDMGVKVFVLDENKQQMQIDGEDFIKEPENSEKFKKGNVDNSGVVTAETPGELYLTLTAKEYNTLKTAKHLKIQYKSDDSCSNPNDPIVDHNLDKVVKVKTTDYLTVQIGVIVKGAVNIYKK